MAYWTDDGSNDRTDTSWKEGKSPSGGFAGDVDGIMEEHAYGWLDEQGAIWRLRNEHGFSPSKAEQVFRKWMDSH